jgi:hypothetical protein
MMMPLMMIVEYEARAMRALILAFMASYAAALLN